MHARLLPLGDASLEATESLAEHIGGVDQAFSFSNDNCRHGAESVWTPTAGAAVSWFYDKQLPSTSCGCAYRQSR